MTRPLSPFVNSTPVGSRRRPAPRPLSIVPVDHVARAETAVGAATLLRDLDALIAAGLVVPEMLDGEVRYAVAPDAPDFDDAA